MNTDNNEQEQPEPPDDQQQAPVEEPVQEPVEPQDQQPDEQQLEPVQEQPVPPGDQQQTPDEPVQQPDNQQQAPVEPVQYPDEQLYQQPYYQPQEPVEPVQYPDEQQYQQPYYQEQAPVEPVQYPDEQQQYQQPYYQEQAPVEPVQYPDEQQYQQPYYQEQAPVEPYRRGPKVRRETYKIAILLALVGSLIIIVASFAPWVTREFEILVTGETGEVENEEEIVNALGTFYSNLGIASLIIAVAIFLFGIIVLRLHNKNKKATIQANTSMTNIRRVPSQINIGRWALPNFMFLMAGILMLGAQILHMFFVLSEVNDLYGNSSLLDALDIVSVGFGAMGAAIGSLLIILSSFIMRKLKPQQDQHLEAIVPIQQPIQPEPLQATAY